MKSRLMLTLFVVASLFTIWWFGRPILESYRRGGRLDVLKDEVEESENKKTALLMELKYLRTGEYVEKEARDRLNMVKEGEKVVILPKEAEGVLRESAVAGEGVEEPNWVKWKRLFLE